MTNSWINKCQNWNAFYTPYISQSLRIQNIFCCMRCDTRTEPFNFWNFRCRKRSKKTFCSFDFWELSKFYFNVFPETNVVYLLAVKDSLLGKSLRENYFSDAKCLGPLLQRSPLNTINNVGKIFCHINYGVVQGFPSLRTEAITTHVKRYDIFLRVFDIANQLLTRHSPFAPLAQVDEWAAKPSPFSTHGRLSEFFRIMYGC